MTLALRVKSRDDLPDRLRDRNVVDINPTVPRVSIYCAERSHASDPWFVQSFTRLTAGAVEWWGSDSRYPIGDGALGFTLQMPVTTLVGDRPVAPGSRDAAVAQSDPGFRVHVDLTCKTCGLSVSQRSTTIQDRLDRLWSAGIVEISLKAYRGLHA